jgi:hypothetical protein
METNPRARIPGEWSPPPPVVVVSQPAPAPRPRANPEEEFETTLGGLVEHFANLPPARYGEPPELAPDLGPQLSSPRDPVRRRSWTAVGVAACAVVLGGGVALGAFLGWRYLQRPEPHPTAPVKPQAPIQIVIRTTAPARGVPQAEPLLEHAAPAAALPAVPDDQDDTPAVATGIRPVKPNPGVGKGRRHRKRASGPVGAPAAGADGDPWEDPYR